jgi:hypothetical protein
VAPVQPAYIAGEALAVLVTAQLEVRYVAAIREQDDRGQPLADIGELFDGFYFARHGAFLVFRHRGRV